MTATTATTETCRECGTTDARHHWMLNGHQWWICDECETHGAGQPYRRCLQPPPATGTLSDHSDLVKNLVGGHVRLLAKLNALPGGLAPVKSSLAPFCSVDTGDSEIHLTYTYYHEGRRKATTLVVTEILEEDIDVRPSCGRD